jgi:hypothetical protein
MLSGTVLHLDLEGRRITRIGLFMQRIKAKQTLPVRKRRRGDEALTVSEAGGERNEPWG